MKLLKIGLFIAVGFLVIRVLYRMYQCSSKGKKSGNAYKCPLFSADPVWLVAQDQYTMMREGKCYEIIDYGEGMNVRRVELEECGEEVPVKRSESFAEYEVMD